MNWDLAHGPRDASESTLARVEAPTSWAAVEQLGGRRAAAGRDSCRSPRAIRSARACSRRPALGHFGWFRTHVLNWGMGPNETPPSGNGQHRTVRADTLEQVEPDHVREFVVRPYSLTVAELGGLSAALANEPTPVRAWVRYPAIADQVNGLALAWTPRAVYVEWEAHGTHRAWVWASAVERAAAKPAAASPPPSRSQVNVMAVRDTQPLVTLVNAQLNQHGAEFVSSMAQAAGSFGAVVFGSIDGHSVRLEFTVEPSYNGCVVHLFDMSAKEVLAERALAPTFEGAIESYPWAVALHALTES